MKSGRGWTVHGALLGRSIKYINGIRNIRPSAFVMLVAIVARFMVKWLIPRLRFTLLCQSSGANKMTVHTKSQPEINIWQ